MYFEIFNVFEHHPVIAVLPTGSVASPTFGKVEKNWGAEKCLIVGE